MFVYGLFNRNLLTLLCSSNSLLFISFFWPDFLFSIYAPIKWFISQQFTIKGKPEEVSFLLLIPKRLNLVKDLYFVCYSNPQGLVKVSVQQIALLLSQVFEDKWKKVFTAAANVVILQ
jgi:hypothetical protein